jgi:F0F1-type ATP synthase assembly protein I
MPEVADLREIVYVPSSRDGLIFPVPKNIYEARESDSEGYFSWLDEYRADYEALKLIKPTTPTTSSIQTNGDPSLLDRGMEFVTAVNRPLASMIDIATSPAQGLLRLAGIDVPTLRSTIPERGAFAGDDVLTKVIAGGGEFASMAAPFAATSRWLSRGLSEIAWYGEPTLQRVIRSLGTTPIRQEMTQALIAGSGGEIIAEASGLEGGPQEIVRFAGQIMSPMAWNSMSRSVINATNNMLKAATPTVADLRGAKTAAYTLLDAAGLQANVRSSSQLIKRVDDFIAANDIQNVSMPGLTSQLNKLKKAAKDGNLTFGMVDDIRSMFAGQPKKTPEGSLSRSFAKDLDDFIHTMTPVDDAALAGRSWREALSHARTLNSRYSNAQVIEDIVDNTLLDTQISGQDYYTALRRNLGKLLQKNNKRGRFIRQNKKMREALHEAVNSKSIRRLIAFSEAVGFQSRDLVRNILVGGIIGVPTGLATGSIPIGLAVGGGIVATTALAMAVRRRANTLTRQNLELGRALIQAGDDAREITRAYVKYTIPGQRNPRDLTMLYLNNNASPSVAALKNTSLVRMPLVGDAVLLTAGGSSILQEEEVAAEEQSRREANLVTPD